MDTVCIRGDKTLAIATWCSW